MIKENYFDNIYLNLYDKKMSHLSGIKNIIEVNNNIKKCDKNNTGLPVLVKITIRIVLNVTIYNAIYITNQIYELFKRCRTKLKEQNIVLNSRFTDLKLGNSFIESENVISFMEKSELIDKDTVLHISVINLANIIIDVKGAEALAKNLAYFKNLTKLNLSDNFINAEGVKSFAKLFTRFKNLTELNLCNNNVKHEGAKDIAEEIPRLKILAKLGLGNNDIGDEGAMVVVDALSSHLCFNKNLTELDLSGNNITDKGAAFISLVLPRLECLISLNLNKNHIGDEGTQSLANALPSLVNLEKLFIGYNNVGEEGAKAIAFALSLLTSNNLTVLALNNNNINKEGSKSLANVIPSLTCLTRLLLQGNKIEEGANDLVTALTQVMSLTELSGIKMTRVEIIKITNELKKVLPTKEQDEERKKTLNDLINPPSTVTDLITLRSVSKYGLHRVVTRLILRLEDITDEIVKELSNFLFYCDNLTEIDLFYNKITSKGAAVIAKMLPLFNKLSHLDLSYNSISAEGAVDIAVVLPLLKNLTTLNLRGNNIGNEGAFAIADVLPKTEKLTELWLSLNNISDKGKAAINSLSVVVNKKIFVCF